LGGRWGYAGRANQWQHERARLRAVWPMWFDRQPQHGSEWARAPTAIRGTNPCLW
jgi:hypothetical protein